MEKEIKDKEPKQVHKEKQKAVYIFASQFKTTTKTYQKGDDCFQTDATVIAYLLKNKIIKKK